MTDYYKKNILDYITNNVNETTGNNTPQFNQYTTLPTSISSVIREEIGNNSICGYIAHKETNILIVYGNYSGGGYICLFDTDLNKLAMITQFASGSNLFSIKHLEQAEDGTFYGISQERGAELTARILLLNNFVAKREGQDYQVILRQSYIIPSTYNLQFIARDYIFSQQLKSIVKVPNTATYYLMGMNRANSNTSTLVKFVINVGAENEWTIVNNTINAYDVYDILIQVQTEEKYKLYLFYSIEQTTTECMYEEMEVDQDNNIKYRNKMTFDITSGVNRYEIMEIVAKSPNEVYVAYLDYSNNKTKLGRIMTGYIKLIHEFLTQSSINMVLDEFLVVQYLSTAEGGGRQIGILQDETLYLTNPIQTSSYSSLVVLFRNYNLVNIYEQTSTNETIKWILDYNPNNYNGVQYTAYNQTKAYKGRLSKNGEIVFARNLYNNTINENTATSTLQVPNTMLNNVELVSQSLLGETNRYLIDNYTTLTKNIYETLYINFIRTLNVIDEDTNTSYHNTASYITRNINIANKQNCESSYVGKVRIKYSNESIVQNITWEYTGTMVNGYYKTEFVIDATEEVPTIEFISKDETTTYITKTLNVNVGSYYVIRQKLRIGDD